MSRLIEHARIEYAPEFAAAETKDRFLSELQDAAETDARRLLYVALTRARDKLVMEWPGYLSGKDNTTYWSILTGDSDMSLAEGGIQAGERDFPCLVVEGQTELPDDLNIENALEDSELPVIGRRAIQPGAAPERLTPDSRTPSQTEPATVIAVRADLIVERYGEGLEVDVRLTASGLGTFIHRCFEVLGSRPDLKDRIPQVTGVEIEPDGLNKIAAAVERSN